MEKQILQSNSTRLVHSILKLSQTRCMLQYRLKSKI